MAGVYRKREGSDTWHFCTNCTNWPKLPTKYKEQTSKPTTGEFCDECLAKKKAGNCN